MSGFFFWMIKEFKGSLTDQFEQRYKAGIFGRVMF
jgi:hypothetical protein